MLNSNQDLTEQVSNNFGELRNENRSNKKDYIEMNTRNFNLLMESSSGLIKDFEQKISKQEEMFKNLVNKNSLVLFNELNNKMEMIIEQANISRVSMLE
jgi:hypothetical protein